MRLIGLAAVAILATAGAARADGFCTGVKAAAAGARSGFKALRGPVDPAAHTSSFNTYHARLSLPGAKDCGVVVPGGTGLGPPTYSCEFTAEADARPQMTELVRHVRQCLAAKPSTPALFKPSGDGLSYGFTVRGVRYEVSSTKGGDGGWAVNLEIRTPGVD